MPQIKLSPWKIHHVISAAMALTAFSSGLFISTPQSYAANSSQWVGSITPSDWFDQANWDSGVPTSTTYAQFNNGGAAVIASGSATCQTLDFGESTPGGSILLSGGSLQVSSLEKYASTAGSIANFTQTGGSHVFTNSKNSQFVLGNGGTASYTLIDGSITVSSDESIGNTTIGNFSQSGGTHSISGPLYLGQILPATGNYVLSGGSLSTLSVEYIGYGGTGTFNQSGGTNAATTLSINSHSSYTLTGGTLQLSAGLDNSGNFSLGGAATMNVAGMVNLANATLSNISQVTITATAPNSLIILPAGTNPADFKSFSNSSGMTAFAGSPVVVPAGTTIAAGAGSCSELILCSGTITGSGKLYGGIMVQDPAANTTVNTLRVDNSSSGISNGQLSVFIEYIGYTTSGAFTQSGGNTSITGSLSLGYSTGATGTYYLSGGTLNGNSSLQRIGDSGTGNFVQSGGTYNVGSSSDLTLGNKFQSVGNYSLGGGNLSAYSESIGALGTGTFVQAGGTNNPNDLIVGAGANSSGSYTLSNGQLIVGNVVFVGNYGSGTFSQSGGTNTNSLAVIMIGQWSGSSGTYSLSGTGTLSAYNAWLGQKGGSGVLTISGGSATFTSTIYIQNATCRVELTGGSLSTKTLNVTGGSFSQTGGAFSCSTITSTGNLHFDVAATVGVINMYSGTLSGYGSLSSDVSAAIGPCTIAPSLGRSSSSTGTLTLHSLITSSVTTMVFNLVDPAHCDSLKITANSGLTIYGGNITVNAAAAPLGFYKIIKYSGSIQGAGPSSLTLPTAPPNLIYTLDQYHDTGYLDLHLGLLGDASDDGNVNSTDLTLLASHWLQSNQSWSAGDLNADGTVNSTDLSLLASAWSAGISDFAFTAYSVPNTPDSFKSAVDSIVNSTPEPSSLLLLTPLSILLFKRRK